MENNNIPLSDFEKFIENKSITTKDIKMRIIYDMIPRYTEENLDKIIIFLENLLNNSVSEE